MRDAPSGLLLRGAGPAACRSRLQGLHPPGLPYPVARVEGLASRLVAPLDASRRCWPDHGPLLRRWSAGARSEDWALLTPYRVLFPGCLSPVRHRRLPPWRSARLRGLRSAGARSPPKRWSFPSWAFVSPSRPSLLGWPISRWAPLMAFARRAFSLTRRPGLQRLPPSCCAPFSRQAPTTVAFLADLQGVNPQRPVGPTALQRSKPPGRCRAVLQGIPRSLPASGCSPEAPTSVFLTPSWGPVQRASVVPLLPANS